MDEWKRETSGTDSQTEENGTLLQSLKQFAHRKELLLAAVILVGITAMMWPKQEFATAENVETLTVQEQKVLESARQQLADEVQNILSGIKGIGRVEVSLTLSSDGVREYAFNQTEETRESSEPIQGSGAQKAEKTVSQSLDVAVSGGNALLVENHYPQVTGVLVVAEGAQDILMQQKICDAVAVLLDISPHRVRVLPGEETKE